MRAIRNYFFGLKHLSLTNQFLTKLKSLRKVVLIFIVFLNASVIIAQFPATDCNLIPDVTISGSGTQNISSYFSSGSAKNKKILIQTDVIIDISFQFIGCLVMVEPGKKITTGSISHFKIDSSNFFSCSDRWLGIEIGYNNVRCDITSSGFENALNAFLVDSKSIDFIVYNNDFFDNHVGIYLKGTTTLGISYNFGNKYHGQTVSFVHTVPFDNLPAFGIRVEGTSSFLLHYDIGNFFTQKIAINANEFYSLYISGIYMEYAHVNVFGCKFYTFLNMPSNISYYPIQGAGITNYNSDLGVTATQAEPFQRCTFDNLDFGVYFSGPDRLMDNVISYSDFSNCSSYGIQGWLINSTNVTSIHDNTFTQIVYSGHTFHSLSKTYTCIRLDGTSNNYGIDNNVFNSWLSVGTSVPSNPSFQVFMNGYGAGGISQPTFGTILYNTFNNAVPGGTHFYMSNTYNKEWLVMEGNTFNGGQSANYNTNWEAGFFDCENAFIRFNNFNDAHSTDNIHFQGLNNFKFCMNDLQKSNNVGVHAYYFNNIELAKTQFGDHLIGLYLDKIDLVDPVIGLQPYRENCWPNLILPGRAQNDAASSFNVLASKFTVNASIPCHMPAIIFPSYWFLAGGPYPSNNCEYEHIPGLAMESPFNELTWEAKYEWYRIIKDRGPANDFEAMFMDSVLFTGIPELDRLENDINLAINTSEDDYQNLTQYSNSINTKYATISAILLNAEEGKPSAEDSVQIRSLLSEISSLFNSYIALGGEVNNNRQINLNNVYGDIEGQSFTEIQEMTYQKYLSLVSKARISGTSRDEIHSLALELSSLDPYEYGPGARKGNHFLNDVEYSQYIEAIAQTCLNHPELIKEPTLFQNKVAAKDDLYRIGKNIFEYDNGELENSLNYIILDRNGRLLKHGSLNEYITRLDLRDLLPGMYFVQYSDGRSGQKLLIEP